MSTDENNNDLASLRIDRSKRYSDRPLSRKWWWLVGALVAVGLVIGYYQLWESAVPALKVRATSVTYLSGADATANLVATGYVVAQRLAEVASKGTGRLDYIGYDEGDTVTEGAVIARLENDDIQASLSLARANLELARVDSLNAGRQYRRQLKLHGTGSITDEVLEEWETSYLTSVAAVRAAEAAVQLADVDLDNTLIRAPFSGTVLTKNAEVGEIVAPFASSASSKGSVVTLADMNSLEVEADVNEANINRVTTDQRCDIILDAYPSVRYPGYVKKIVPTADRARATVLTRVAFAEIDERVLPEMSARVNFYTGETEITDETTALVVPNEAVTNRDGRTVVFRIDGDFVSEIEVETGRELGDYTEITVGLTADSRVVLSPPGKLSNGQKIEITQ
jgi:RND family efflux transporter MFP subunit